jgi:lysozyme
MSAGIVQVSSRGEEFIKAWEGFRASAYDDGGGVRTVGYGTTSAVIDPLPSSVTVAEASALLERALRIDVYPAMLAVGKWYVQHHFDAIASAVYNLGSAVLSPERSLGMAVRSDTWIEAVPAALELYVYDAGELSTGLEARRRAEAQLWLSGVY